MKKKLIISIALVLVLSLSLVTAGPAAAAEPLLATVDAEGRPHLEGTSTADGDSVSFNIRAIGQADDGDDNNTSKYYGQTHFDNEYYEGYEGYDGAYSHYNGLYITDTGIFEVTVPPPPPPTKADILSESGVPGNGLEEAPGLQKPFNPNSQAGNNARYLFSCNGWITGSSCSTLR